MRRILIQPQARVDLLEIWHYVAPNSITTANKVIEKLKEGIDGLAEMPGKGHRRVDVRSPRYRFWSVYSYMIAYYFDEETISIVRVVHGSRNFRRLFRR